MNYCTPKQVPSGLDMQLCPLPPAIDLLQLSSGEFAWFGAAGFELPIPVLSEDSWDWEMKIDLKSCFQPRVHVVFLIKHNQKGRHFRIGFHGYFCAISKATHLNNIYPCTWFRIAMLTMYTPFQSILASWNNRSTITSTIAVSLSNKQGGVIIHQRASKEKNANIPNWPISTTHKRALHQWRTTVCCI